MLDIGFLSLKTKIPMEPCIDDSIGRWSEWGDSFAFSFLRNENRSAHQPAGWCGDLPPASHDRTSSLPPKKNPNAANAAFGFLATVDNNKVLYGCIRVALELQPSEENATLMKRVRQIGIYSVKILSVSFMSFSIRGRILSLYFDKSAP